jgi:hypothetical protein
LGITFRDAQGNMTGQMLLLTLFVVPLVMLLKMVAMYMTTIFLRWTGAKVVQDFRVACSATCNPRGFTFSGGPTSGS